MPSPGISIEQLQSSNIDRDAAAAAAANDDDYNYS